ncbi:MAG TPA: hypothetical protein PKA67_12135 [Amaricoccus sp.]|nr:hypothetical protein [Amaricoccus sp.]
MRMFVRLESDPEWKVNRSFGFTKGWLEAAVLGMFLVAHPSNGIAAQQTNRASFRLAQASSDQMVIPPRKFAEGKEIEPNDGYEAANQVAVGESIVGHVFEASPDWFAMRIDPTAARVYIKVRTNSGDYVWCNMNFYTGSEQGAGRAMFPDVFTSKTLALSPNGETVLFVALTSQQAAGCSYELFTAYSPDEL